MGTASIISRLLLVPGLIILILAAALNLPAATPSCDAYRYAYLANLAYEDFPHCCDNKGGCDGCCDKTGEWCAKEVYKDPLSGLEYYVFVNSSTGEAVLSFRGTQWWSPGDWASNLNNALGGMAWQYQEALITTAAIKNRYPDLVVTGHSLGGGLAAYIAMAYNLDAYTFNPAGIGFKTNPYLWESGQDRDRIRNYVHEDDPLRKISWADRNTGTDTVVDYAVDGMFEAHSIDNMEAYLKQKCEEEEEAERPKPTSPEQGIFPEIINPWNFE